MALELCTRSRSLIILVLLACCGWAQIETLPLEDWLLRHNGRPPSQGVETDVLLGVNVSGPSDVILVAANSSWAGVSANGSAVLWDHGFQVDFVTLGKGVALEVRDMHLENVVLPLPDRADGLLHIPMFFLEQDARLRLTNVTITTTCHAVAAYAMELHPDLLQSVEPYRVSIRSWGNDSSSVSMTDVAITCTPPPPPINGAVEVRTALQLANAAANTPWSAAQPGGPHPIATIILAANISLDCDLWPATGMRPGRRLKIRGRRGQLTVLDLRDTDPWFVLRDTSQLSIEDLTVLNLPLPAGYAPDMASGIAPLFSLPCYFIRRPELLAEPVIQAQNVTLVLPMAEYRYLSMGSAVITAIVLLDDRRQDAFEDDFGTVRLLRTGRDQIFVSAFDGRQGVDITAVNITLTHKAPEGLPFATSGCRARSSAVPTFDVEGDVRYYPHAVTLVPAYNTRDLVASIHYLAMHGSNSSKLHVALLNDMAVQPRRWPRGGMLLREHLCVLGQPQGVMTTLDLQGMAGLVRLPPAAQPATDGTPVGVILRNLLLTNLPFSAGSPALALNFIAPPVVLDSAVLDTTGNGSAAASSGAGGVAQFGISSPPPAPRVQLAGCTLVIPFREYVALAALVQGDPAPDLAEYWQLYEGLSVARQGATTLLGLLFDELQGFGWQGSNITVTYDPPPNFPPLNPADYSPQDLRNIRIVSPPAAPPSSRLRWLSSLQFQLAISGAAAAVMLIFALLGYLYAKRRRKQRQAGGGDAEKAMPGPALNGAFVAGSGSGGSQPPSVMPSEGNSRSSTGRPGTAMVGPTLPTSHSNAAEGPPSSPVQELGRIISVLTTELDDKQLLVLDVLGKGAHGTVYKGIWRGLPVAVKTIMFAEQLDRVTGAGDGAKAQQQALMEAAITAALSHPNVVSTYSYDIKPLSRAGSTTGLVIASEMTREWKMYIVQELCDAGTLRNTLERRAFWHHAAGGPLLPVVLQVALHVGLGLEHIHSRNIIHGDLNPSNILLKRDAASPLTFVAKIADFGLSVRMRPDQSHISNLAQGTPFYAAPEVVALGSLTKAADIYAFGVVLWELHEQRAAYKYDARRAGFVGADGFPAFQGPVPHLYRAITEECLDPEPHLRPSLPRVLHTLRSLLQACMQQDGGASSPGSPASAASTSPPSLSTAAPSGQCEGAGEEDLHVDEAKATKPAWQPDGVASASAGSSSPSMPPFYAMSMGVMREVHIDESMATQLQEQRPGQ